MKLAAPSTLGNDTWAWDCTEKKQILELEKKVCQESKLTIPNFRNLTTVQEARAKHEYESSFSYYNDIANDGKFQALFNVDASRRYAPCNKFMDSGTILEREMQLAEMEDSTNLRREEADYALAENNVTRSRQGVKEAHEVINKLDVGTDVSAFTTLLQRCTKDGNLADGRRIHGLIVASGLECNTLLEAPLIHMYTFFERLLEAQQVFSKLFEPNVFSWSAIISAYGKCGQIEEALRLYWLMQASTVEPDGHLFLAALQACSTSGDLHQGREIHGHVIASGWESDIYLGSGIIDMYSTCGCVVDAHAVFNRLPRRNVVTWSALIKGYAQLDHGEEALQLFMRMQEEGLDPDQVTFICILKACSSVPLKQAWGVHACVVERGFELDPWVANVLVDLYARCENVGAAQVMFNRMPNQNVVSYSALITGYIQCNHGHEALNIYEHLLKDSVEPDIVIFVCIVKACTSKGDLDYGRHIHAHTLDRGCEADVTISSTLIDLYAKCSSLVDAQTEFLRLPVRNIVTWNALITGYSQQEYNEEVLQLFYQLQEEGMHPDSVTFGSVLKAYSSTSSLEKSRQIHNYLVQRGIELESIIGNALVDSYSKQGSFADALVIFETLPKRDVVTWSALIGGYIQHGCCHEALHLFEQMQLEGTKPDPVAFACILKTCSSAVELDQGRKLHRQIICDGWETDTFLGSVLVDMYSKCGSLDDACKIFCKLEDRSVVTWNAMIAGYAQLDNAQEALNIYKKMQADGHELNLVTLVCSLKACSSIAAMEQGRHIHGCLIEKGYEMDVMAGSTLINMYAKCGSIEDARVSFERLTHRNVVTWSALIGGYAQHSDYYSALKCFLGMKEDGYKPDEVAFLCLLSACSHHANLVETGCLHVKSMIGEHHIVPKLEHFNSLLDLLGNAGQLDQAEDLLETIPCRANDVGWTSLLNSCKTHAALNLGRRCFDRILSMDFGNTAGYVLMAGIYAEAGMLEDARKVEELRKHANGWKKPAKAYIEIDHEVHSFFVGDKVHPRSTDIYAKLTALNAQMKEEGYQPRLDLVFNAKSDEDRATILCGHSEKLAVAFGLISTPQGMTVRVSKNLKMCADCHMATKIISKMELREIIITDTYCVHRFQNGECSCNGSYR